MTVSAFEWCITGARLTIRDVFNEFISSIDEILKNANHSRFKWFHSVIGCFMLWFEEWENKQKKLGARTPDQNRSEKRAKLNSTHWTMNCIRCFFYSLIRNFFFCCRNDDGHLVFTYCVNSQYEHILLIQSNDDFCRGQKIYESLMLIRWVWSQICV